MINCLRMFAISMAGLVGLVGSAAADCATNITFPSVTVTIANYDPFAAAPVVKNAQVRITNNSGSVCDFSVAVRSPNAPTSAPMSNGSSTLNFGVDNNSGAKTILYSSGTPVGQDRINFNDVANNATVTRNVDVYVLPNQIVAADSGAYISASSVTLDLFSRNGQVLTLVRSVPFSVQATVLKKCQMSAPSMANLNFSGAIANGRPNAGVVQTTTFSNVQCTAPSRLRLSGAALAPVSATPQRPGFDNFINFQAVGNFGGATATLISTPTGATADSSSRNVVSGATPNGDISVGVNLINGQPILAGAYAGILSVTIDPAL